MYSKCTRAVVHLDIVVRSQVIGKKCKTFYPRPPVVTIWSWVIIFGEIGPQSMYLEKNYFFLEKHVFVEKPLTYLSEDGQKLVDMANKNNVVLTCGYIERFNPAVSTVKDFLTSKKYGDLIRLEFYREHRMPQHIKDVGIIYDTAVHDIDTAMWLFGKTPEVVFAIAGKINHEHEDFATIMLGFKDNKTATISSNWITPIRVRNFNAVCTDARIFSDFITQEIRIETDHGTENPKNEKTEPLLLEIKNFLGAIETKNDIKVKAEQAVNVTKIAEAALLSSQKGIPIYLDIK